MGGTDVGLSFSASASSTSGARVDHNERFGDFFIGGGHKSQLPTWIFPIAIVAAVMVSALYLIRKHG